MFEPTQASTVLRALLQDKKISIGQFFQIIEHRREVITRRIINGQGPRGDLGQLSCMDSGDGVCHALYKDRPNIISPRNEFSLVSQGLYAGSPFFRNVNGDCITFGTDTRSWLLIKINFVKEHFSQGENSGIRESATSVEVSRVDLPSIIETMEISPYLIWEYLEIEVNNWFSQQEALYKEAISFYNEIKRESGLISLISRI